MSFALSCLSCPWSRALELAYLQAPLANQQRSFTAVTTSGTRAVIAIAIRTRRGQKCRSEDGCKIFDWRGEGPGKYAQTVKKDEVIGINYETMKYVTYPRLNEDIYNIVQENGGKMPTSASDFNFYGVCLDKCPEEAGWVCSSYGHALLVDNEASVSQFSWKVEPGSKKETVLETCKTEAEATGAASAIPPSL